MFDHFLTSILQVVIVLDVLGAITYFVLGGLKRRDRKALEKAPAPLALQVEPLQKPFWKRFFWRQPHPVPATEGDFTQLQRILYSFREGLA